MKSENSIYSSPAPISENWYTPNHAKRKLLMIFFGLGLLACGLAHLWNPLRIVILGKSAKAEATCVVKTKQGLPDQILTDDTQVQANLEPHDRTYIFWNEFVFNTADGRVLHTRANVGSIGKPLYALSDADGLPTTDLVYYDPAQPETVIFPLIISTWLVSALLVIIGSTCAVIGSFLFYWAKKPIELPHIPSLHELEK